MMKRLNPLLVLLLTLLALTACGAEAAKTERDPAEETDLILCVANHSGTPVTDLRIALNTEEGWGDNRLRKTLEDGEKTYLDLGDYTWGQLEEEFRIVVYDENDIELYGSAFQQQSWYLDSDTTLVLLPEADPERMCVTDYDPEDYDPK